MSKRKRYLVVRIHEVEAANPTAATREINEPVHVLVLEGYEPEYPVRLLLRAYPASLRLLDGKRPPKEIL